MRDDGLGVWGGLSVLFGCNVLFAAGLFSHALLYNFYLDALGLGEAAMGGAAAALMAGGLAALVPAGQVVDRLGPRRAYAAASILCAAGLAAGALVQTPGWIGVAAFAAGAGTSSWRVAMGPLIMRLSTPSTRARAFSWNVALLLGSGAIWTAVSGAIPGWLERTTGSGGIAGVRTGLIAGAMATLLAAPLVALVRVVAVDREASPPEIAPSSSAMAAGRTGIGRDTWRTLRDRVGVPPRLAVLVLLVAIWMVAGGLVIPFLNLYFLRVHGLSVARIGLLFGVTQAITALVVFASGDAAARLGARRMLLLWAVPFAPLLWLLGLAGSAVIATVAYVVQGFVPPATNPLIDQLLLERAPASRQGAVSTWRNAATELSGLAGAAIGGILLAATSFRVLFLVAGVIALAGALGLAAGLSPTRERAGSA